MENLPSYLSIIIAIAAFVFSLVAFLKGRSFQRYTTADNMLIEILKLNVKYPLFNSQTFTSAYNRARIDMDPDYQRYDVYAMMIWNYLETLVDYYGPKKLLDCPFSGPVAYWAYLHSAWYHSPGNREYYSDAFEPIITDFEKELAQARLSAAEEAE